MPAAAILLLLMQSTLPPPMGGPSSTPVNTGRIITVPGGTRRVTVPQ